MGRLTKRYDDGRPWARRETTNLDVIEKLAEYEDLEEQGRLVVLPDTPPEFNFMRVFELIMADSKGLIPTLRCNVGDTVYLKDCYGNMYAETVRRIIIDKSKIVYDTDGIGFDETAFGSSVFLSREEAAKAFMEVTADA